MNKIKSGFTLIEILIVIAIIGVLSVSLVPNIAGAPARARDLAKKQAITQADAAMKAYIVLNGQSVNLIDNDQTDEAETCLVEGDGDGVLTENINAALKNKVFDGEIPVADTLAWDESSAPAEAASIADCMTSTGKVYPKFTYTGGKYKLAIKVEAGSSANDATGQYFEMGSLVE